MKVLLISNFNIEEGRGPMFRLRNMIPYLNRYCEIHLLSLGEIDGILEKEFSKLGITIHETRFDTEGWFVKNTSEITRKVERISNLNSIDIVILTWEIWDVAVELYIKMQKTNISFAVLMHSVPFAAATIKTRTFLLDSFIRFIKSRKLMIKKYIIYRFFGATSYMNKLKIIIMSETVEKKLYKYFPSIKLYLSYPGYACEVRCQVNRSEYLYDCAFMARFEYEKGIFELIEITRRLKTYKSNIKIVMIGSFTFESDELKFKKLVAKHDLEENIFITGWITGNDKYNLINESKLFIYPSFTGDTFSQAILEALSCGKKVICYDVPFTKDNFNIKSVIKVPVFNNKLFASETIAALKSEVYYYEESCDFVKEKYGSWDNVARAEYECYKDIIFSDIVQLNKESY